MCGYWEVAAVSEYHIILYLSLSLYLYLSLYLCVSLSSPDVARVRYWEVAAVSDYHIIVDRNYYSRRKGEKRPGSQAHAL